MVKGESARWALFSPFSGHNSASLVSIFAQVGQRRPPHAPDVLHGFSGPIDFISAKAARGFRRGADFAFSQYTLFFRGAGTVPLRAGCPPAFGAIPWSSGPKQAQNPPAQPIPPPPRARVKRARALANLLRAPRETYTYSDAQIQRADPTHPGTDPSLSSAPCATRGLHTQSPRTRSSHLPGSRKLRESRTVGARSCTDSNPPRLC